MSTCVEGAARCGVSGAAAVATSARDRHRCILGMHFEHDNCPIALEFIEICSMHTKLDNVKESLQQFPHQIVAYWVKIRTFSILFSVDQRML